MATFNKKKTKIVCTMGPATESSWPVNVLPPTEGSLDEATLLALITVLAEHTADAVENEVEVDPAHRQQEQGAEHLPAQQRASGAARTGRAPAA